MRKHADEDNTPPSAELVEALSVYGFKPALVEKWTTTRAKFTLDERKKQDAIVTRRAIGKAKAEGIQFEGESPVKMHPLPIMRLDAARYLAEPMSADDLTQAVASCIYQLDDSEVKRLAGYLVKLFSADNGYCSEAVR